MTERKLTESLDGVWARLRRLDAHIRQQINRALAAHANLSIAEYEVLSLMARAPEEPLRALVLRNALEWEKSRLSHQLRRMEARGLVVRLECVEDNRGSVIRLTEHGRRLAAEAQAIYEQAVRRTVTDALDAAQRAALDEIIAAIVMHTDAERPATRE